MKSLLLIAILSAPICSSISMGDSDPIPVFEPPSAAVISRALCLTGLDTGETPSAALLTSRVSKATDGYLGGSTQTVRSVTLWKWPYDYF